MQTLTQNPDRIDRIDPIDAELRPRKKGSRLPEAERMEKARIAKRLSLLIHGLRADAPVTVKELAGAMGLSYQQLMNFKHEPRHFSLARAKRLERVMDEAGVPKVKSEMVGGGNKIPAEVLERKKLADALRGKLRAAGLVLPKGFLLRSLEVLVEMDGAAGFLRAKSGWGGALCAPNAGVPPLLLHGYAVFSPELGGYEMTPKGSRLLRLLRERGVIEKAGNGELKTEN